MTAHRPGWVWAIAIFYWLSTPLSLYILYLVVTERIPVPLPPTHQAFIDRFTLLDYGLWVFGSTIGLAAATALFLLRRAAVSLYAANIIVGLAGAVWSVFAKNILATLDLTDYTTMFSAWALTIMVFLYSRRLRERGALR